MHEFSIADALLRQVLEHAESNDLERVEQVEIDVGALQLVVTEALDLAFRAVAEDTLAAGAELKQNEIQALAICRACSSQFDAAINSYLCPQCGQADAEIIEGRDIILKSLSGPSRTRESVG